MKQSIKDLFARELADAIKRAPVRTEGLSRVLLTPVKAGVYKVNATPAGTEAVYLFIKRGRKCVR